LNCSIAFAEVEDFLPLVTEKSSSSRSKALSSRIEQRITGVRF